ncbi:MAG: Putative acetolactate synthase small subunit [Candidatus Moanabacter tarae]|uniref:Acetolactate synthase small subunit n=1 Tax=Candidatus Moanibacter tarae TaxID=2200854 RepID=A0A2Z4AP47_9BACT|nr:MAG: Putative acetolactate synthase small subunit [Candidatus Moanabacter tarae]|tara:strand:+ start:6024 stop:6530 length:507 start_codon:yes stop_codon:yes gene_type:complete
MRHTISVVVENNFGVLARVAGLFSGRGFNIDTLNVGPTHDPKFSRITATVMGDTQQLDQCIKQLKKLVEVIDVKDFSEGELAARELVIVKIAAEGNRSEIIQICDIFRAKIIDVSPLNLIVELTGDENKIEGFLEIIASYGIEDMARTGSAALPRIRKSNPRNEDKID